MKSLFKQASFGVIASALAFCAAGAWAQSESPWLAEEIGKDPAHYDFHETIEWESLNVSMNPAVVSNLVILAEFSDDDSGLPDADQAKALISSVPLSNFPNAPGNTDVAGPFTLPLYSTCDLGWIERRALEKAVHRDVDLTRYDHIIILFPEPAAGCAAKAFGSKGQWGVRFPDSAGDDYRPWARFLSIAWVPVADGQLDAHFDETVSVLTQAIAYDLWQPPPSHIGFWLDHAAGPRRTRKSR